MRPESLHSRSTKRNCPTENVSSRPSVKVAIPSCAAKAAIPCGLAVRRQHEMLFDASKFESKQIGICGGKECMKKELRILVILIAVLLVGTVGCYFMPKKFGKNVNPSEVDHINVFDGNTGTGFTITDSEDIEYIVANIQGISMKRDGISLGRTGYSFKINYINSNDKDIIPVFILNSDNTICKDPFFYRCDGGLCFDYLKACEEKYRTNVTESIEEK